MSTRLVGHVIAYTEIKVQLVAGEVMFVLTLIPDGQGQVWRYNVSEATGQERTARVAFGRVIAPDHRAAARCVGEIAAGGYVPGSVERGLFDMLWPAGWTSKGATGASSNFCVAIMPDSRRLSSCQQMMWLPVVPVRRGDIPAS